jgi:hypothetical protein
MYVSVRRAASVKSEKERMKDEKMLLLATRLFSSLIPVAFIPAFRQLSEVYCTAIVTLSFLRVASVAFCSLS